MSADTVEIKISQDLVKPIIEKKIQAAIIEALNSQHGLIEEVALKCVQQKVNYRGDVSQYSSDNKYDMVEICLRDAVKQACLKAIADYVAENKKQIEAAVRAMLKNRPTKLAKALIGAINKVVTSWNTAKFTIDFATIPETDD